MDFKQLPLRDFHTPEAVSWWPLAPGWWLLLVLLVLALWGLVYFVRKQLRSPRRQALNELQAIEQAYQGHQNKQQLLMECNQLLKRLALTLRPRDEVASLSGDAWLSFLGFSVKCLAKEELSVLAHGPYQPNPEFDEQQLLKTCRKCLVVMGGGERV